MRCRTLWLVFGLLAAGCMEGQKAAPVSRTPSPYTRLGGTAGLEKVVDHFVARAAASTELRPPLREAFRGEDVGPLKQRLVRGLGAALGGPYPGTLEDLRRTLLSLSEDTGYQDMGVLLGLLDRAMEDADVGPRARQDVLAALKPLRQPPEKEEA